MKFSEYQASRKNWQAQDAPAAEKHVEHEARKESPNQELSTSVAEAESQESHVLDHDQLRMENLLHAREHHNRPATAAHKEELKHHSIEKDPISGLTEKETERLTGELVGDEKLLAPPFHHHWVYLIVKAAGPLILFLLALVAIVVGLVAQIIILSLVMFLVLLVISYFLFSVIYEYMNDYLVLTNFRFIRTRRDKFIDNLKEQLPVERAEESRLDSNRNFIQLVLDVGKITIPGAGASQGNEIVFKWVHHPEKVQTVIEKARGAARSRINETREGHIIDYTRSKIVGSSLNLLVPDLNRQKPIVQGTSFWHDVVPVRPEIPSGANRDFRLILHKHWFKLVEDVGALLLFLVLDISVGTWFMFQWVDLNLAIMGITFLGPLAFIIWLGSVIGLVSVIAYRYVDWKNDQYIITDSRVIDVERKPFGFNNTRLVIPLTRVQKSEKTRRSPLELFFNYGNVEIFTASGEKALDFIAVPFPEKVEEEITYRTELAKERDLVMQDRRTADLMAMAARAGLFTIPPPAPPATH